MAERRLVCGAHGQTPAAFACRHVREGIACGFHDGETTPDEPERQGWCDLCERLNRAHRGWTVEDEVVMGLGCMCEHCFGEHRARNVHVPPHARGRDGLVSRDEWPALVRAAATYCRERNTETDARWPWKRACSHRTGKTITFGGLTAADSRPLGLWNERDAFTWGWHEFSGDDLARLRVYGEVRGLASFASPRWTCRTLDDARAAAVVAAYVLGAASIFQAEVGGGIAWLLLSNFRALS